MIQALNNHSGSMTHASSIKKEPPLSTVQAELSFEVVPRGNIREVVVGRILRAVMRGEFPAGHRLVVQRLSEQFGVSATPLREAIVELAAIGMVENLPNRGAVMREFGPTEIREIYQLRRILEVEAVHSACHRIDGEILAELQSDLMMLRQSPRDACWSERAMQTDVRLHEMIAGHCGSNRLRHELARYNTLVQVIREVVDNESQAQEIALSEHLEIVQALIDRDAAAASEAMARHLQSTASLVQQSMFSSSAAANI